MKRTNAPTGWSLYNKQYVFKYMARKSNHMYEDTVHYDFKTGVSVFKFTFKVEDEEIDCNAIKKSLSRKIKQILDFDRYLLIVESRKNKGSIGNTLMIQFYSVLKSLPTNEQLMKMKDVCTSIEEPQTYNQI